MYISQYDRCQYQSLTLDNGLRVLLVRDPHARKAAAAINVALGQFHDPDNCQGMGHLLEHMLFLGCQRFPQPNHLADFVGTHGGHTNAWTGTEHSGFHFDVAADALDDALAHFAAMLSAPSIDPTLLDKEIHSIEAEYQLRREDDLRCLYQVHKETCNPAHPFSRFAIGNRESLTQIPLEALRHKLIEHHQRYFVARNMTVCVVSDRPFPEAESAVRQHFEVISDAPAPKLESAPPLYQPDQLGVVINVKPHRDTRRLIMSFALPSTEPWYLERPLAIPTHLLGDEGPNSLLSVLKRRGWVSNLSAGGGIEGSNFRDFNINLQLTDDGAQHWRAVTEAVFGFIRLIQSEGINRWRFDEHQRYQQMAFNFHDNPKAIDYSAQLCNQMQHYPEPHWLDGDYIMQDYKPERIHALLAQLTPDNMRLKLIMPDVPTDTTTRWYNTEYQIQPLADSDRQCFERATPCDDFILPVPNPYLDVRTATVEPDPDLTQPERISHAPGFQFWFGQDDQFRQPKGEMYLSFDCQHTTSGPAAQAYKRIWTTLLQEHLTERFYQAQIGGCHFHCYAHQAGFSLHTNGMADKQMPLALELLKDVQHHPFSADAFEQARVRQARAMHNSLLNKPINRLFTRLSALLQPHAFSPMDLLGVLDNASYNDFGHHRDALLAHMHLEGLAYGDWPLAEADRFSQALHDQWQTQLTLSEPLSRDITDLRGEQPYLLPVPCKQSDAALLHYIQAPSSATEDVAGVIMLEQILSVPFFNQLRTEKQLGYLVGSAYMPFNQHPGLGFYVQSPTASLDTLYKEVMGFLAQGATFIKGMDEEDLRTVREGIIRQLKAKDASLSMRGQRFWLAIGNGDHEFTYAKRLAKAVGHLSRERLIATVSEMLVDKGYGGVTLYSDNGPADTARWVGQSVPSLNAFKQNARRIV